VREGVVMGDEGGNRSMRGSDVRSEWEDVRESDVSGGSRGV
jgi:hypothetical protein